MQLVRRFGVSVLTVAITAGVAGVVSSQQRDTSIVAQARDYAVGQARVTGVIVDAVDGRPVPDAFVELSGQTAISLVEPTAGLHSRVSRHAMSDRNGVFALSYLPAGRYRVHVSHSRYLPHGIGQRRAGGEAVAFDLADGQAKDLAARLVRGGAVSGTVYDAAGEPVRHASVSAARFRFMQGVKQLQMFGGTATDDRGHYRLHGLQPGDYFIVVRPQRTVRSSVAETALIERAAASAATTDAIGGRPATVSVAMPTSVRVNEAHSAFVPTFYPSAAGADAATAISVVGGDEHTGIDVHAWPAINARITGIVTNPPGDGLRLQASLMSATPDTYNAGTGVRPDGRFEFGDVVPGTYTLLVSAVVPFVGGGPGPPTRPPDAPPNLYSVMSVVVPPEGLDDVTVTLLPGRSVSGQVSHELNRPLAGSRPTVRLSRRPGQPHLGESTPNVSVDEDGRFVATNVPPGHYLVQTTPLARSVMLRGQDLLDFGLEVNATDDIEGLEVIMSERRTQLSGRIVAPDGYWPSEYMVVIAATDERYWTPGSRRIATARAELSGRYQFGNLPAGPYFITAVLDLEPGQHHDPAFLKSLRLTPGQYVTLAEGAEATADLAPGRARDD